MFRVKKLAYGKLEENPSFICLAQTVLVPVYGALKVVWVSHKKKRIVWVKRGSSPLIVTCERNPMLNGSETRPINAEHYQKLGRAKLRMVR